MIMMTTLLWLHFLMGALFLATRFPSDAHKVEGLCLMESQGVCQTKNATEATDDKNSHSSNNDCGLWMAPSSIPNAGWSIYTGKVLKKNDILEPYDLAVQMVDYLKFGSNNNNNTAAKLPDWILNMYYWSPSITGASNDGADMSVLSGLGALPNNHPAFFNIAPVGIAEKQHVSRSSPQAGAYTEYKRMQYCATQDIPAFHELSMNYGSTYFDGTPIPTSFSFARADKMLALIQKVCLGNLETSVCEELWQMVRHGKDIPESTCSTFLVNSKSCKNLWNQMIKSRSSNNPKNAKIIAALPQTLQEVKDAMKTGCAWYMAPNVQASQEWLVEHGLCLDHLEPRDESTIDNAGSGAFAKQPLAKGSFVAPAPVAHLHRDHLDIHVVDEYDSSQVYWKGKQLLWNYVYSHPSTSLVFFPYSPVVNFINHSPTPNVELQWSDRMLHPEWMNLSATEIIKETVTAGLMMELVALRDIHPGEEILLNYGSDWQEAWEKHVGAWKPPVENESLRSVESYRNQSLLPTLNDTTIEPLSSSLDTQCWVNEDHLVKVGKREYNWLNSTQPGTDIAELFPCTLVSRSQDENETNTYNADVKMWRRTYRVNGIHRRAIEFVPRPYTSNQYLRQSFRHEIRLPDRMIPDAWKDQKEIIKESSSKQDSSMTDILNDYMVPVRTQEEQAVYPYPESIFIGCYHHQGSEPSEEDTEWEFTHGMYDSTANASRCVIIERHGDDEAIAASIRPPIHNYTAQVWSGSDESWMLTGVPRRAIEFFYRTPP